MEQALCQFDSNFTWNMCLTYPTGTLLEVMSTSGDSSSAFSSTSTTATPSIDRTPSINQAELTHIEDAKTISLPDSSTDSAVILFSSSTSNFELQEHAMPPLSSTTTSESMENMTQQRKVMSLDAVSLDEEVEVGELSKKDNAKSAFEITSVRPANTDDHDRSGVRNPVSNDSLRVILPDKGELGECEESILVADDKRQVLTTDVEDSTMQAKAHSMVGSDSTKVEEQQLRVKNEGCKSNSTSATQGSNVTPSGAAVLSEDLATGGTLAHPVSSNVSSGTGGGGGGAVAGNGSSVQPNRFRRVNQYDRGRWTVRDTLISEEQAEMTTSVPVRRYYPYQQHQQQDQSSSDTVINGTLPRIIQQHQRMEHTTDVTQFQASSLLGMLLGVGGGGGGGLGLSDVTSDKDSSSIHMDRSSTAAETISRNTSMSSIVAPEKSIDEDESEVDSISGVGCSAISNSVQGHEHDLSNMPTAAPSQPPGLATLSVGAVPPPSLTTIYREEQSVLLATASGESGKESIYE